MATNIKCNNVVDCVKDEKDEKKTATKTSMNLR